MSKDVSITDLIAKIREMPVGADWVTLTEDQSGWLHMHRAALVLADALESVTVPTENEESAYDVAYALYGEHDTLGVEGTDPRRECFEAGWAAAIARLPVPVEPEYEYGFSADGGPVVERAFGIVPFETADAARHTGSKWFEETLDIVRRTKATPAGEWEPIA